MMRNSTVSKSSEHFQKVCQRKKKKVKKKEKNNKICPQEIHKILNILLDTKSLFFFFFKWVEDQTTRREHCRIKGEPRNMILNNQTITIVHNFTIILAANSKNNLISIVTFDQAHHAKKKNPKWYQKIFSKEDQRNSRVVHSL